jgi:hypothetical protein
MSEEKTGRTGIGKILASEITVGILVAVLSIMTAFAAYQGSLADSAEADANVEGQKVLSLSNTEFLRANQDIIQDYTMFDGYYLNQDTNEEAATYYQDNFSEALTASMEREEGPFDDAYYEAIYLDADGSYDEAMTKFDEAQAAGDKADQYQLVVLVFAVALSLVAWASLVDEESKMRVAFVVVSLAVAAYGLFVFLGLFLGA